LNREAYQGREACFFFAVFALFAVKLNQLVYALHRVVQ
jgi:hypothetical protein